MKRFCENCLVNIHEIADSKCACTEDARYIIFSFFYFHLFFFFLFFQFSLERRRARLKM